MTFVKKFFLIIMALVPLHTWGQSVLTEEANAMRDSDLAVFQLMEFCNPGHAGNNETWDFSSVYNRNEDYNIFFTEDSLFCFHKFEGQEKNSYIMKSDVLEQYKFENRLTKIKYFKKKLAMRFPFQYGDSISSKFEGYGKYCGDHLIKIKGQVMIQADGWGKLILSEKDTLDNVLRVYTLTTTAMAMDVDLAELDSTELKQEIEEKYEWYSKGFRYPVYTIIQKTSFTNLEPVGRTRSAYRMLPENFYKLNDAVNDSIRNAETEHKEKENPNANNIFHYNIRNGEGGVDINYTADANAYATVIISSAGGILYKKQSYVVKGGESGNIHVSTRGLFPGRYVLYINVNGRIYSKTINIR